MVPPAELFAVAVAPLSRDPISAQSVESILRSGTGQVGDVAGWSSGMGEFKLTASLWTVGARW
jgi:hypothetical protein